MQDSSNQSRLGTRAEADRSITKFINWMKEKINLGSNTVDKTTRQSVSTPATPTLVRAGRLRSASEGDIVNNMERTQGRAELSNQGLPQEQSSHILQGALSEESRLRNQNDNVYGSSPDVTPMNGFESIQVERGERQKGSEAIRNILQEPASLELEGVSPLAQLEREISMRRTRSGVTYGNPNQEDNNKARPAPAVAEPTEVVLDDVGEEPGLEIPLDLTREDVQDPLQRSPGNRQESVQCQDPLQRSPERRQEKVTNISKNFQALRKSARGIKENMYAYPKWWLNVDGIINPLLEELEKIIDQAEEVSRGSFIHNQAITEEENLLELRDYFKKQAKVKLNQVNEANRGEFGGGSSSTAYHEVEYRWENQTDQETRSVPFSIKLDVELEQHLDETRVITNMNTRITDAESKAAFAKDRVRALEAKLNNIEDRLHNCDPQIYERLTKLEGNVRYMYNTLANKAEFEVLASTVRLQESEFKEMKSKGEEALKEIKALTARVGRGNRGQDGPDWGSDIVGSRDGTPTYGLRSMQSSTRVGQQVRFAGREPPFRTISQVDGQPDSISADSPIEIDTTVRNRSHESSGAEREGDTRQTSRDCHQMSPLESCRSASAQMQASRSSYSGRYSAMPADDRIDLNARQPVPSGWSGTLGRTPLYSMNQISSARHVGNRQLGTAEPGIVQESEIKVVLGPTESRAARSLNSHRLHVLALIKQNALETLDTHERVKDAYNTCRLFIQSENKELRARMDAYQEITSQASQNGTLLDASEQVINWANDWLRGIQTQYTSMGCGLKRLPAKYSEDVPVFDGNGDISIYEFLKRFKNCFQGEGSPQERAELLHRKYLGVEIKRMTEDIKDDLEALIATLMDRFGHPQTVVSNILRTVPATGLPTASDEDRPRLASHLRQLESAFTQISNLPSYGLNERDLMSYLMGYQCLQVIRERIPGHMIVDLNRILRENRVSRTNIVGWDHYQLTREFIADQALDYDYFQPTAGKKSKPREGTKKGKDQSAERVLVTHGSDELNPADDNRSPNKQNKGGEQELRSPRRSVRLTDADGYVKCDMDGMDHKKHCVVDCSEFWNCSPRIKRSLVKRRACYACLGPRDMCMSGCVKNPPKEMLCQVCASERNRFVPMVALCTIAEHRAKPDPNSVLGAMQQFLKRFNAQHYAPEKVLGLEPTPP